MSNMLRGSLTSNTSGKGTLGFKGERGYSNYELYVKSGGTMTEQEWLDHFGVDLTGYCKTSEMTSYVNTATGDLEELETTDKTDLVSAINELNTNVNSLDDRDNYSTTEQVIGTWIDGKPIYRKVINFGSLPNAESKSVAHNIANIDFIVNVWGMAKRANADNDVNFFPINESRPLNNIDAIGLFASETSVIIQTGADRSNVPITYVIIEYTKTTD